MKFLFDCDDTLYDLERPFYQAVQDLDLPLHQEQIPSFYTSYRKHGDAIFDQVQSKKMSVDESGIYRILNACQDFRIPLERCGALRFQERYRFYQNHISLSKPLQEWFASSRSEKAILTNGEKNHQMEKLQALKIPSYIPDDHIFISDVIGYRKPDPRAFDAVLVKCKGPSLDWVYIGDRYDHDIVPAKQKGMRTIHFNRHRRLEGPLADHIVYQDEELVALLLKMERGESV